MPRELSGVVALQFGGESGAVGTTPVDLAAANNSVVGTAPISVPMPQEGAIRGLSVKLETGVASAKTATVAVTKGGTEGAATIALAATDTEGYARFDKSVMTFAEGDEIGVSLTGGAADSIATQVVCATVLVQLGKSEI